MMKQNPAILWNFMHRTALMLQHRSKTMYIFPCMRMTTLRLLTCSAISSMNSGKVILFLIYDRGMELVSYSDYNNLMQLYGKDPISMGTDEFIVLCDFQSSKVVLDDVLESGMEVTIFGKTLYSKYDECQDGFVVPDDVVQESGIQTDYLIGNYPDGSKAEKAQTEETVLQMQADLMDAFDKSGATDTFMIENNTRIDICEAAIGLGRNCHFYGDSTSVWYSSSPAVPSLR